MKKTAWILVTATLVITAYLFLWPIPVNPVSWQAPRAPEYSGPHAPNNQLGNIHHIALGGETGPEHVAFARDGKLYAAMASGNILRMNSDGTAQEVFVNSGGRVLGFDFGATGNLIAADAMKGLLSIKPDRTVRILANSVKDGDPISYANAVVVATSGKIYFTDATTRFAPQDWGGTFTASILDIMEQSSTGRVLEYDPVKSMVRIVAKGLSFANGIALSQDEQTVFVNETGRYRVWKIAVHANQLDIAQNSELATVLLDNLPGYPDNLMRGLDGRIWLGFAKPRNPVIDAMSDKPFLRQIALRLPRVLWPVPKAYGHVMAFNEEGIILDDLQDPTGTYPETTAVTETRDRLYVQSLHARSLGWLDR